MPTYDPNDINAVQSYYQKYLGRAAGADDPNSWLSGSFGYGTDLGSIERGISGSDEAKAWAKSISQLPPNDWPVDMSGGIAQIPTSGTNPPAPPVANTPNYWDPNVFNQIVGRQPNANETSWYSQQPDWYTQVQHNTPGYTDANPFSAASFQQVTGRAPTAEETNYYSRRGQGWLDEVKKNTPNYTANTGGGTTGGQAGGDPGDYLLSLLQGGMDQNTAIQQTAAKFGLQQGQDGYPLFYSGNNTIGLKGSYLANVGGKWNKVTRDPREGQGGGYNYGGTSVFSDPATQQFEQLLNSMINRFANPQTPPGYQQAIDQMNAYLAKLNGPAYTPAQLELQQTQALDPLQQAHDTQRQQLMLRLGQQGISPSSGIFEKALEDLDRQFSQARTTTQANFANQAIGIDRQNAATAAQLAPQISNFQQAQTGWQDQRSLQAEQLAYLIPQMAQSRLASAGAGIQQLNPTSLLNMIQSFQNQGYNQGAGYGSALTQLLAQLFGL